ncbi:MAG: cytochrome c3 family protein [Anaerolinea sp.]|nr:cytochrome c3 family protein [Anaerolinea sp.]
MRNHTHSWIILLVGVGLTLILAGLSPLLIASAQEATQEVTPEVAEVTPEATVEGMPGAVLYDTEPPAAITGDNSYCMVCHSRPWKTVTLGDGTIQNLFVNPDTIHASVHGTDSEAGELGCVDCHGEDSFPHNNPSPADGRAYTLYAVALCGSCHIEEVNELQNGLHELAIAGGNHEAAVCTDCHGAHDIQPVVEQPELIAGVCGNCHETTLVEWRGGAHATADPLGCATCHSPHSQQLRVGPTTTDLCLNCHEDTEERFIHQLHRNDQAVEVVACVNCHMYTGGQTEDLEVLNISTLAGETGHTMRMDATPCTTCHEEMVASGEWERIIAGGNPSLAIAPTPQPAAAAEDDLETAVRESSQTSYVPLIQGLILGLGFGVTFAAVFIARGNRAANKAEADKPSAENSSEE